MKVMSEKRAEYIAESLNEKEEDDSPQQTTYRDPVKQLGWAHVEHILTFDTDLSDGAYRTYALLLSYTHQSKKAWVSVATLAKVRGVKESTLRSYLSELKDKGLISRQRRMGRSAITYIEDLPYSYTQSAFKILQDRQNKRDNTASTIAIEPLPKPRSEEESIEEESKKNSADSKTESAISPNEQTAEEQFNAMPSASVGMQPLEALSSAVADPQESKAKYKKVVSAWFADVLSHQYPTSSDKAAAGQCFDLHFPLDKLLEFCKFKDGKYIANGKEPNAYWIVNGFDEWKSTGYPPLRGKTWDDIPNYEIER